MYIYLISVNICRKQMTPEGESMIVIFHFPSLCVSQLFFGKSIKHSWTRPFGEQGDVGGEGGLACETDHRTSKYIFSSTFSLKLFFLFSQE